MNYQNNDFQVIVGIDFGTDGSGMSYAVKGSRDVHIHNLNSNDRHHDAKTKTNILLNYNGSFIAFGHEATEKYILQDDDSDSDSDDTDNDSDNSHNSQKNEWLLFEKFKMNLYDKPKEVHITPGNDRQYCTLIYEKNVLNSLPKNFIVLKKKKISNFLDEKNL